jgi:hypothetical protein
MLSTRSIINMSNIKSLIIFSHRIDVNVVFFQKKSKKKRVKRTKNTKKNNEK